MLACKVGEVVYCYIYMATILDIGFRESDLLQKGDTHCRRIYECHKIHIMKKLFQILQTLLDFRTFMLKPSACSNIFDHAQICKSIR